MSVNKERPHVFVLPEDEANRQIANGFQAEISEIRNFQILPVAGGWIKVLECFQSDHIDSMERNPRRLMVLMIDFDCRYDRLDDVKKVIPNSLRDRVFILGVWSEPEALRRKLGSYESIGKNLAEDCRENTEIAWSHPLLKHNVCELDRCRLRIRPILFSESG